LRKEAEDYDGGGKEKSNTFLLSEALLSFPGSQKSGQPIFLLDLCLL